MNEDSKELGIIIGTLRGIQASQEKTEDKLDELAATVAEIQTDIALIKADQSDRSIEMKAVTARVDNQSRDLARVKGGSWKVTAAKYIGSALGGGGIIAAILSKILGIKLGGGE